MSWSTPRTWATSEVVSAANMNTYISNNLSYLGSFAAAEVQTSQTTASTTYTDLATAGPAVTLTTLTTASVDLSTFTVNSATNFDYMGVAVSGASTIAGNDAEAIQLHTVTGFQGATMSGRVYITGLTAGSNTFTAKYRVNAGTGTFQYRRICVTPLTV